MLRPNGWALRQKDGGQVSPFHCYTMERDRDPAYAGSDCRTEYFQLAPNETSSF
jgi:hypothetical protein